MFKANSNHIQNTQKLNKKVKVNLNLNLPGIDFRIVALLAKRCANNYSQIGFLIY